MNEKLKALRAQIAAHAKELNAIVAKAAEEDREYSAQEAERKAFLEAEIAKLKPREEDFVQAVAREREIANATVADQVTRHEHANGKFETSGQFYKAVVDAAVSGYRNVDPRLFAAAQGLEAGEPASAGFLVPDETEAGIITKMHSLGQILSRVRTRNITRGNALRQNAVDESSRATGSRWGGVRAYWINEAGSPTKSKPKFRRMETFIEDLAALYYATEDELEDAEGLGPVLDQAFAEELTFTLEDAIIRGDGAAKPLGILNAACLVSVAKETSQAAATVLSENISKMWSRLPASSRASAVWLGNVDVEPELDNMFVAVKNVAGAENVGGFQPIVVTVAPDGTYRLKGRPFIPVEYCETLGTKGDLLLCDFSQYQLIAKGGPRFAESIHVQFLTNERTFRVIMRRNGQPLWDKALTPYKGTNTQSPFISLDTRS